MVGIGGGAPTLKHDIEAKAPIAPALYYAALEGLENTTKCLSSQRADVNIKDGYFGNALQAASCESHEQIARLYDESYL